MQATNEMNESAGHEGGEVHIQIDRVPYKVDTHEMTGQQLRALPNPPVPQDRDLFLVVPGGPDKKIGDTEVVELRNGQRFFTAPGQINPGVAIHP